MTLYARNEMILATEIVKSFKTNLDKVTNQLGLNGKQDDIEVYKNALARVNNLG